MSEDCLSLNIIRPSNVSNSSELPVAVWIHGGGLYSGSSRQTNLTNFVSQGTASNNPFIAVSINYRLNAFGFLWGSDEVAAHGSANNGLRDQRLALSWIQENIGFFGGDPSKVTIFGQSSGGLSVGKQLIAYGGRDDGLFRAAILQSGGMAEKWPYNIEDPGVYTRDLYMNLTTTTGCEGSASPFECLRELPIESLSAGLNISNTPVFAGTGLGPWLTQVDGDFLLDGPTESLDKRHFVPVPIMYTTTTDEATAFSFVSSVDTDADFRAFVAAGGPDEVTVSEIEKLYPRDLGLPAGWTPTAEEEATYGAQWKRAVAFHTDAVETCSRRRTVNAWTAANGTAYAARINILAPNDAARLGSHHSVELDYVFGNVESTNKALVNMAKLMSRVWASFVVHLDPNHHHVHGVPLWPVWSGSEADGTVGYNFVFNTNGSIDSRSCVEVDDYRLEQTRYLNSVMQRQMYY
ncbi:Carboxylic ester hydrolase [Aspergillus mulundensis]|uniref:Carboxylic ester hydrolase n=1 Tax=Aspergillus mulundensis TaxID=1810919 RepID=A0A3D8RQH7_9EURO|nr:Carboxylic ester hydrolase [Aspergillus mulundensis]RDW76342.1 Carboxylic ester hydrolase [Aspergillus mulundensis]